MCGIAGFTGKGDEQIIRNMIDRIRYRGPDARLSVYDKSKESNAYALAHARLSILDVRPEGNQPMYSSDRKTAITFNGEIYNYLSLKNELDSLNKYSFQTKTDTEVLLYLYQEFGEAMLEKLNGMFAFAIYDLEEQSLFIARDRMGQKPLYYSEQKDAFVFASEPKALLQHPSVGQKLNLEAVNQFLTFDYVPTPACIIQDVYKLEPGYFLKVKHNKIVQKEAYWKNNFLSKSSLSFKEAMAKLDRLLNDAVNSRLMSDVPLGVFLSGGLDSSTVAYYAQKNVAAAGQKIKTFSIGFEDKSYDEASYAQQVAQHLGTEHHTQILTAKETLQLIAEIYPKVDEPFADASLIPTYFLSKFTRQQVTVALGGDGSDELLAGYPTFTADYFKQPLSFLPKAFSQTLLSLAHHLLPASDKNISFDFKVKQYLRGFAGSPQHIHQLWLGSFLPEEKKQLFKQAVYRELKDKEGLHIIDEHFKQCPKGWTDFEKITYYYYQTYLVDSILTKVDRASMYNALEVRAPFLDKNVVAFLNALPRNYKQKGLNGKYLLKTMMRDKLPAHIIDRPKKGFGIPLSDWIRKDLKKEISEVVLSNDDLFNANYKEKLLQEHQSGRFNHRKLIWNLFMLKMYLDR